MTIIVTKPIDNLKPKVLPRSNVNKLFAILPDFLQMF